MAWVWEQMGVIMFIENTPRNYETFLIDSKLLQFMLYNIIKVLWCIFCIHNYVHLFLKSCHLWITYQSLPMKAKVLGYSLHPVILLSPLHTLPQIIGPIDIPSWVHLNFTGSVQPGCLLGHIPVQHTNPSLYHCLLLWYEGAVIVTYSHVSSYSLRLAGLISHKC